MASVKEQRQQPEIPASVLRIAAGAEVSAGRAAAINSSICLQQYRIARPEAEPEECGYLLSLPVADDSCSIQLLYTMPAADNSGELDILSVSFHPQFLAQWPDAVWQQQRAFRLDRSAEHPFIPCTISKTLLAVLLGASAEDHFTDSLRQMETAVQLLRRAMEILAVPFAACAVPACRFLAYESEREKIFRAGAILDERYDENISIKELSRMVAINECYLKKGFKALLGKTVHEYQAAQRIIRAKTMLQGERRSVTEVAALLGYSSISHFSTAFRKATGMKPCELLQ